MHLITEIAKWVPPSIPHREGGEKNTPPLCVMFGLDPSIHECPDDLVMDPRVKPEGYGWCVWQSSS